VSVFKRIRPLQAGDPIVDKRGAAVPAFALLWQQIFANSEQTDGKATK
jgi:hypothetical protein